MKKTAPPSHLSPSAKTLWRRLFADYRLDDAGGELLLRQVCESFDRLREARLILAREGIVIADKWGQKKPHPAAVLEHNARTQLHSAMRLLKLDPGDIA